MHSRVYVTVRRGSVRLVCPSVPFARRSPRCGFAAVGYSEEDISIDCCPALSSSGPAVPQQQLRAVPRCQTCFIVVRSYKDIGNDDDDDDGVDRVSVTAAGKLAPRWPCACCFCCRPY